MIQLQQIQSLLIKTSLDQHPLALSKLLSFSVISDKGDCNYASSILTHARNPTNFMYNMVIRGFSQSQQPQAALLWFTQMASRGQILPDNFTFTFLLKACTRLFDLRNGQQFHSQITKAGHEFDSHVVTSLMVFYISSGYLSCALILFERSSHRSVAAWNVMISGFSTNGKFRDALVCIHKMRLEGKSLDEFTLVSVASACANVGVLFMGKCVHGIVSKSGFSEIVPLANALIGMYGKCGSLHDASKVFYEIDMKNIVSYSTMIDVYGLHGYGKNAVEVFNDMLRASIEPDKMAFTSILCACSHSGMLGEGKKWFKRMTDDYGLEPTIQHYGCLVDLLAKAGKLKEAYGVVRDMPINPDAAIWRSLIGACLLLNELDLAEVVADHFRKLDVGDAGDVVLLSNVYATLGRWEDVERSRRGVQKDPSLSFIEVDGSVNEFVSEDEHYLKNFQK